MGRLYTVTFDNVTVTPAGTDQDLFAFTPADDKPIAIHAIYLSQSSEIGDAMEELLRVSIIRGHATTGSGGTAPTPAPLQPIDAAAGFTARVNDTTIASAGTAVTLHAEAFNVRVGWVYLPIPEMRPVCTQAQTILVVRLLSTVADDISMSGTAYVEELA
jgi:hypothetical protein